MHFNHRYLLTPLNLSRIMFFYILDLRNCLSFLLDLSWQKITFLSLKLFSLNLFIFPTHSSVFSLHFFTGMISFLAFNHTFHAFWPRFWYFLKTFGVFRNWWSFGEIFGLGYVYMILNVMHFNTLALQLDFHAL